MIWQVSGDSDHCFNFRGRKILKNLSTALLVSLSFFILSCGDFHAAQDLLNKSDSTTDMENNPVDSDTSETSDEKSTADEDMKIDSDSDDSKSESDTSVKADEDNESGSAESDDDIQHEDDSDKDSTGDLDSEKQDTDSNDDDTASKVSCKDNPCNEMHKTVCTDSGDSYVCSCEEGYVEEKGECISEKQIPCTENTDKPSNSHDIVKNVSVFWEGSAWSKPGECDWECDTAFHTEDNSTCISNTKSVPCRSTIQPANTETFEKDVTVTWIGNRWSTAEECEHRCISGTSNVNGTCRIAGDSMDNPYSVAFEDNSATYDGTISSATLIDDYSGSCGSSSDMVRDVVYEFSLSGETEVIVSIAGDFDPVIYILDKNESEVACATGNVTSNGYAEIKKTLTAGKWSLVLDGNTPVGEGNYIITFTLKNSGGSTSNLYKEYENLRDDDLAYALYNEIKGGKPLGYSSGARDVMFTELDNIEGKVECFYTGRTINNPTGSGDAYQKGFNTEHSWPQSQFGKREPMKSDLHHLFPTVVSVNGARSSYDFGNVGGSGESYCGPSGSGCSKRGTGTNGGTVFEVRPERRGDIARAHFYMAIRYYNQIDDNGSMSDGSIRDKEEAVLRKWHKEDPVDEREMRRNNLIEKHQGKGNRNPFIDRPDFVDFITDF